MTDTPDGADSFMSIDLFALRGPNRERGVLCGVHIHHIPPAPITGNDVAQALATLAATLSTELDNTYRSIRAEAN
jgi:hypothetical protein